MRAFCSAQSLNGRKIAYVEGAERRELNGRRRNGKKSREVFGTERTPVSTG